MSDFENIDKLKEYIKRKCTREDYSSLIEEESDKRTISDFLRKQGYEDECKMIEDVIKTKGANEIMYEMLTVVGFDCQKTNSLMKIMRLSLPIHKTHPELPRPIKDTPIENDNLITINYDEAWRKIIFTRHFKDITSDCSLQKIKDLAGGVYHEKEVFDFAVKKRTKDYLDEPSIWGITEEILNQYKHLPSLKNKDINTLSKEIGDGIIEQIKYIVNNPKND